MSGNSAMASAPAPAKLYNVGMYIRLSLENTAYRGKDSESIENQQALLSKFIEMMPGWVEKRTYIDNGASGGNFNRKGFQDMMTDIRNGEINLVLVKDLSRFGRNYLEAGKYLEEVLPSLNCRFVALDDGIDTETGENDILPFLNAMNDFYLKNLSDKVKSVLTAKAKNGQKIGHAPYGYLHNRQDHTVYIDENEAAVVRRIYDMRLTGVSTLKIVEALNNDGIPAPRSKFWRDCTVLGILKNEFYIGNSIQNKRTYLSYRSEKVVRCPEDEWIRADNTHEAIISQEVWEQVQAINKETARPFSERRKAEPGVFAGLLYCGGCGRKMISNLQTNRGYRVFHYYCSTSRSTFNGGCQPHTIGDVTLRKIVLNDIRAQAERITIDREGVLKKLQGSLSAIQKMSKPDSMKRQRELESRLHTIEVQAEKLYEDKVMGAVSNDEFSRLSQQLESERREKSALLDALRQTASDVQKKLADIDRWAELIENCSVLVEVDRDLLESLIDRIEISGQEIINGVKSRGVRIFYRYVGQV